MAQKGLMPSCTRLIMPNEIHPSFGKTDFLLCTSDWYVESSTFNVLKATPLVSNAINEISALNFLDMGTYSGPKLFPTTKIILKGLLDPIYILAPLGLLTPESVYCNSHVCLQLLFWHKKFWCRHVPDSSCPMRSTLVLGKRISYC